MSQAKTKEEKAKEIFHKLEEQGEKPKGFRKGKNTPFSPRATEPKVEIPEERPPPEVKQGFKPKPPPPSKPPPKPIAAKDPLELPEFNSPTLRGLYPRPQQLIHKCDASGYMSLVEITWETLTAIDPQFGTLVPYSVFVYHAVIAYWYRIYHILESQGKDPHDNAKALRLAINHELCIPKPLWIWLSGIGDMIDPNRREWHYEQVALPQLQIRHGISGYFQRMSHLRFIQYMTVPSPGVAVQAIFQDMYADELNVNDWNLPQELQPRVAAGFPNANLLCWKRPNQLPFETVDLLRGLGLEGNLAQAQPVWNFGVHTTVTGIMVKTELLKHVTSELSRLTSKMRMMNGIPVTRMGSNAQIGYIDIIDGALEHTHRSDRLSILGYSAHQLPTSMSNAIDILHYRIHRPPEGRHLPVRFLLPPQAWLDELNSIFIFGEAQRLNQDDFGLPQLSGYELMIEFIKKFVTN